MPNGGGREEREREIGGEMEGGKVEDESVRREEE